MNSHAPVVIIGSKPEAAFPAVPAQAVITANGAALRALPYRERYGSRIIALVGRDALGKREVQESLVRAQPEEVHILGEKPEDQAQFVKEGLGLSRAEVSIVPIREYYALNVHTLGARRFLRMLEILFTSTPSQVMREILPDILGPKTMRWRGYSTGLFGVLYALRRFKNAQSVIAAGIGLEGGAHFDGSEPMKTATARKDRMLMRHWPRRMRPRFFTTDEAMHRIGDVPLFGGETFSEKR